MIGVQACQSISAEDRLFENEKFMFTIPAGWQTMEEVWDRPQTQGSDYYGLGLQELVMIQYPPVQGKGKAYFAVAYTQLQNGDNFQSLFDGTYLQAEPGIEDVSIEPVTIKGYSGTQITYRRPWGEPWWNFRDTWFEKEGEIFVFSFHSTPGTYDEYSEKIDQILESFQLKN